MLFVTKEEQKNSRKRAQKKLDKLFLPTIQ
jgi:hypothetical protein